MHYQFQFEAILKSWPLLLQGTLKTIQLSLSAMVIGLLIAIVCSWGKSHGGRWPRMAIDAYIEIIRNTPFLVQLFFFFFALPTLGLQMSASTAALVTMFVNLGAF